MYAKTYLSRSQSRVAQSLDIPVGDPFGGPAYGEKRDIGTAISVGVPIVTSLLSSDAQSSAAQSAADTSAGASRYAADVQKQIFDLTRSDQAPWREAGVNALAQLRQGTGAGGEYLRPFSMSDYQSDPGYQFRLSEGMKALDRSAAARGGLLSGAQLKGIQRFGQGLASEEYQNAFNRYQTNQSNSFNRLAAMSGLGQTANNSLQSAGQNYAGNVGNIAMGAAGNQGTAQLIGGQARASAYGGIGNALARGLGGAAGTPPYMPSYSGYSFDPFGPA